MGSNEVSADSIAVTVKAWDKHPSSFASIKVLESEGSNGSSAEFKKQNKYQKQNDHDNKKIHFIYYTATNQG